MMNDSGTPAECRNNPTLIRFTGFFYGVLGAAIVLALMILLLSGKDYLALSNYLQILAAIAASCVFLYVWHRFGRREIHLYAAGAFGLWGISNIAWYVNILIGQRNGVFPSLIDIGMIAAIFLLAIAFRQGLPPKPVATPVPVRIPVICLLIPVGVIAVTGISLSSLVTLLYFIACGTLIVTGLVHAPKDDRNVPVGAFLFAFAFMIYPLREMFFITNPALFVIGTFVSAGFALIAIGLLTRDIRGQVS
jgi:hypothetical protein